VIDLDSWHEIAATLRKNPLRTFLTGLGVFLGLVILLVMVGFGRSLESGVQRQMAGFATNAVYVWGLRTTMPHGGLQPGRPVRFDNRDVEALRRLDSIEYLAPKNQLGGFRGGYTVKYGGKTGSFQVAGDYPDFQHVQQPLMRAGRFIDPLDIRERRKVCVIGTGVVDQLYPPGADPIGTYIQISGVYFRVVGVFATRQTGQQAERTLNTIHVPFTSFQQAFNFGDRVGWFAITGKPGVRAAELERQVRKVLADRHRLHPDDEMAIGSWNTGKQFGKMRDLFGIVNWVLWFAGLMTLFAGAVGVSNIMLISVRERTRELGVRKALGATPAAIIRMIVAEAVVLTCVAGYLGLVAGVAALQAWEWLIPRLGDVPFGPAHVGLGLAVKATGVLVAAGVIAGIIPAYHAAKIEPVEALRTE
jgi:putative ABC transport system permease protein